MDSKPSREAQLALAHLSRFIDFDYNTGTKPRPMYVTANGIRQEMPERLRADATALRAILAALPSESPSDPERCPSGIHWVTGPHAEPQCSCSNPVPPTDPERLDDLRQRVEALRDGWPEGERLTAALLRLIDLNAAIQRHR